MTSPVTKYSGTCTSKPVGNIADLVRAVAEEPLIPGAVSTISKSTEAGSSMPNTPMPVS